MRRSQQVLRWHGMLPFKNNTFSMLCILLSKSRFLHSTNDSPWAYCESPIIKPFITRCQKEVEANSAGAQMLGQSRFQKQWEIKSFADWITKTHNGQNEVQNATISKICSFPGYKIEKNKIL